jgi:hypothetical protein
VHGSVEGATLKAEGDISISEGVNGMERAQIIAGGNIKCKYLQNAYIKSGMDIYVDTAMYCTIECLGNLELAGKRGRLIAGRAIVAGYVKANTIGTDSHVPTLVNLNCAADTDAKIKELSAHVAALDANELKIKQFFARVEDLRNRGRFSNDMLHDVEKAATEYKQIQVDRDKAVQELEAAKEEQIRLQQTRESSYITCKGRIHSGVTIQIGPLLSQVYPSVVNTRVMIIDGEIKFINN